MHAGGFYSETSLLWSAAELMLAEAVGLVNTLDNWTVVDTIILSTKTPEKKRIFGKGNFQSLTGIIYWHMSLGFYEPLECLSVLLLSCIREDPAHSRNHSCVRECGAPVSFV